MNTKYLCDSCGQLWELSKNGLMNTSAPSFCPSCGSPSLHTVRSSFVSLTAACFAGIDPTLLSLLYEVWAVTDDAKRNHPTFLHYVTSRINGA